MHTTMPFLVVFSQYLKVHKKTNTNIKIARETKFIALEPPTAMEKVAASASFKHNKINIITIGKFTINFFTVSFSVTSLLRNFYKYQI